LSHAEAEIDLPRVAPRRDGYAMPQDQPVRRAARADRTENLVVRRALEITAFDMSAQVARPRGLVRLGEAHRISQRCGIELHGPVSLPGSAARRYSATRVTGAYCAGWGEATEDTPWPGSIAMRSGRRC